MGRKKKKKSRKSRHHICPKSRGGTDSCKNIAIVDVKAHQNYHTLFGNMTPEEIIEYLQDYFWKGKYQ